VIVKIQKLFIAAQMLLAGGSVVYLAFGSGEPVNKDSQTIAAFEKRVADYVKVHNRAQSDLGAAKATDSPGAIAQREQQLAERIRALRPKARRGVIFTPPAQAEFRRLVNISSQGTNGAHIRTSLARSEPVNVPIRVNGAYPKDMALQSTPSTLLQNLPPLPKEVEYRVVGRKLVLRDIGANLIIDYADDLVR
jgi:hypothetical protein